MKVERVSDQVMIKDVKPGECFERGHGICIKTTEKTRTETYRWWI